MEAQSFNHRWQDSPSHTLGKGGFRVKVFVDGKLAAEVIPSPILGLSDTILADIYIAAYLKIFPLSKVEVKGVKAK